MSDIASVADSGLLNDGVVDVLVREKDGTGPEVLAGKSGSYSGSEQGLGLLGCNSVREHDEQHDKKTKE